MKKLFIWSLLLVVLLSACAPDFDKQEEIVQETEDTTERAIIPKYKISDEYYRTILPFKPGKARGLVNTTVYNRLDMDELEMGLMRLSQEHFDPNDYYYQAGQYLTAEMVDKWISRADDNNQEGLNPPLDPATATVEDYRNTPRYLSHIVEHNFLKKDDDNKVELGGIVIGLALKSVYYFNEPVNGYPREEEIPFEELEKQGKDIALQVLQRVRNIRGLEEIPIMIGLFREQPRESIVPGNFFAKAYVSGNDNTISKWESISEQYLLFPSQDAKDLYYDDYMRMVNFESDVSMYFPNYIGVIGSGYYLDEQLQEMTINIPIQFYGKAEIIGFTEYITGLVMDHFPSYIAVHVYISSIDGPEALITRNAGEEQKPIVHVYR